MGRDPALCASLGGNGEVAMGRGRAGVSRQLPPCDLAWGAEAGDKSPCPCPFQQNHPTAFSIQYALHSAESSIFYPKEQY